MFAKVLIANRGEIAARVIRTCRKLGVATVAVFSDPDAEARHVALADEAVHLPGVAPSGTYLRVQAIVDGARRTGAEAVHPGYGFLSENADAARAVLTAGLAWVGPPPEVLEAAGDKVRARRLARSAGVSVVPGTLRPVTGIEEVHAFGEEHGYPLTIKAAGGGGGRGMRVVEAPDEAAMALAGAAREAESFFGSSEVYLERYLRRPKHIEVQILAPRPGESMWLGARDCSLQRRHQKLIEETPPLLYQELVPAMGDAAVAVADACGYVNAGTVEFLVDEGGQFYFLEINARLQVEHTITEEVLGLDMVACQLRIAAGEDLGFGGAGIRGRARGHAIECRINAEDPSRGFLPVPGRITRYREPTGPGVRVDSGFGEGDTVPDAYDSLVAKLVVSGETREQTRKRTMGALDEFEIEGIPTTIPAHEVLLDHPEFRDGTYSTQSVEAGALDALLPETSGEPALLVGSTPVHLWHTAIAASVGRSTGSGGGAVVAPMHGTILSLLVKEGDVVRGGEAVAVLEAMKMETQLTAAVSGSVTTVNVEPGDIVEAGQVVAMIGG
jgi:acetyl-CoA/propionyl-CoA/long-chain acyl-CoA carboxylase, biotin carboxylase, biotin carboxyl carrier protein